MRDTFESSEFGVVDVHHGYMIHIGNGGEDLGYYRALMSCPKDKYASRTSSSFLVPLSRIQSNLLNRADSLYGSPLSGGVPHVPNPEEPRQQGL